MNDITISWHDTIDSLTTGMEPIRIGDVLSGLGTPDQYLLVKRDEQIVLRVDAYRSSQECYTFQEANIWHEWLVVGWGDCVYLVHLASTLVTKHVLGMYFGHLYADDEYLLVASGDRLRRIRRDGSMQWTSEVLAIDGVTVNNVMGGIVTGSGEWDPPGGWRTYRVSLDSGERTQMS